MPGLQGLKGFGSPENRPEKSRNLVIFGHMRLDRPVRIPAFVEPEGAWTQDASRQGSFATDLGKAGLRCRFLGFELPFFV